MTKYRILKDSSDGTYTVQERFFGMWKTAVFDAYGKPFLMEELDDLAWVRSLIAEQEAKDNRSFYVVEDDEDE